MFLSDEALPSSSQTLSNATVTAVHDLSLPQNFVWGSATAAYQIEGAAFQDGKGPSIWDEFAHLTPSRTSSEHGDIACNHYNLVAQDVALIKAYGMDVYRFSISWSRLIPLGGKGDPVNEAGIAFYNDLIDRIIDQGVKPAVTLYHWDLPLELQKRYGGMLDTAKFREDFSHFARLCFSRFGDRVQQWITFNEPYIIAMYGFHSGTLAPGRCTVLGNDSAVEPLRVGHSMILAHADAVRIYAKDFQLVQKGQISIVLNGDFYEPFDMDDEADRVAAERRMIFYIGWFADPIYLGTDYPHCMRRQLRDRLPGFTAAERELLRQTAPLNAFYGMNHYTSQFARAKTTEPQEDDITGNVEELPVDKAGTDIGPVSGVAWLRVTPFQFQKLLNWTWCRYRRPIYVTENGCPCPGEKDMTVEEAVEDTFRIHYFKLYLDAISRAIYEDGVRVEGYYAWSLMDNYEWSGGYNIRFGITHVDFQTFERAPKKSAWYLKNTFIQRRRPVGILAL